MRETLREARAALSGQTAAQRVLAVAAVTQLHVGGLSLVVLLLIEDTTGSLRTAGLAVGVLSLGVGLARPLQGRSIDRVGLGTLTLAAGLHLLASVVTVERVDRASLGELLALCALLGLTTPAVSVATATVWSSVVQTVRQPSLFGFDTALQNVAYFVGPLLAGAVVAAFDAQRALLVLAAIALVGSSVLTGVAGAPPPGDAALRPGALRTLRPISALLAAMVGLGVVYGAVAVAAVAAVLEAGRDELSGPVTAALFAGGLAGNLLIAPRRPQATVGARLRVRLLTLMLATLWLPVAFSPVTVGAAVLLVGATLGGAHVTVLLAIAARSTPGARGEAFGWSGAAIRLGNAIGVAVGGLVATTASPSIAFLLATASAGAALLAVSPWTETGRRLQPTLRRCS